MLRRVLQKVAEFYAETLFIELDQWANVINIFTRKLQL